MHDDTPTTAPQGADAFAALTDLLALVTSPDAVKARLQELQATERRAIAAGAKLASDRAEHDRAIATERAELDAERRKLRTSQAELLVNTQRFQGEVASFCAAHPEIEREQESRFQKFGESGLIREFSTARERQLTEAADRRGGAVLDDSPSDPDAKKIAMPPPFSEPSRGRRERARRGLTP